MLLSARLEGFTEVTTSQRQAWSRCIITSSKIGISAQQMLLAFKHSDYRAACSVPQFPMVHSITMVHTESLWEDMYMRGFWWCIW